MANIGRYLKDLRKKAALSQQQVADCLQVGRSTYSNYENNYRMPDVNVIENLAILYGVPIESFWSHSDYYNQLFKEDSSYGYTAYQQKSTLLSETELNMVRHYRELTARNQKKVIAYMKELDKKEIEQEEGQED